MGIKRLLVTCEYPPIAGGQGSYFKSLWSGLDPTDNTLLLPYICRESLRDAAKDAYRFMRIPGSERWPARIARLALLAWAMLVQTILLRPREIHVGQLVVGGACALLTRLTLGTPYVVHCHGADLLEFSRYAWARPAIRRILTASRRVIANSAYTAGRIRELYGDSIPIAVVNPSVDDLFFSHDQAITERLRRRLVPAPTKVLITIARLVERKGHDTVIRALPAILRAIPDLHYLIVGDGPYRVASVSR
jgi:phosphatidylinositol alpha-1,6-mannosyltransferase